MLIDYDDPLTWEDSLTQELSILVNKDIYQAVAQANLEYIEDYRNMLFEDVDRIAIARVMLGWMKKNTLVAYHGTRVTSEEKNHILQNGLLPLQVSNRSRRITRALSKHSRWSEVSIELGLALEKFGPNAHAGKRENQVHLTLSKAGLENGFNHYLTNGAEVDGHIAYFLLGEEGQDLLAQDGEAVIFAFGVPGDKAIEAAHPFFSPEDLLARGDFPNLLDEFLAIWCYRIAHPHYSPTLCETDAGLMFANSVPSEWLVKYEVWKPS